MKVFITSKIPSAGIDLLKNKFKVSLFNGSLQITKSQLISSVQDCDALIPLLSDKIDSEVIDAMKNCKIIANYAVGYNNIDVGYAKRKNIVVTNTPDVLTDSTADLAMALTLACARRFVEGEEMMRKNKFKGWHPTLLLGVELKNKIFGILGAGRIGTATAIRAHSFGCKIVYFSNNKNPELERITGAKKIGLLSLLKKTDIISIHLPLNKKSRMILDKEKLSLIKPSAIVINTSRGEIIDEPFLIKMLINKEIFSAGFDVYQNEPKINADLRKLKNVVLLPHLGSATIESRNAMSVLAVKNVIAVLSGKSPITPV